MLDAECLEFAENICRSTYFMRCFSPFGVVWTLMSLTQAFAMSSWERQEWILGEYKQLFGSLPIKMGPLSMQLAFDIFTGGPLMVFLPNVVGAEMSEVEFSEVTGEGRRTSPEVV